MRFSRLKRRTQINKGQLDIAPLIDVVFLLLIFFMLTSNFVLQTGINVRLPKAITGDIVNAENLVIYVTAQDLLFVNDKPTTVTELSPALREASREGKALLLKADTGASLGRVVELWDLCREYGIPQINIATNPKAGEKI